MEQGSSGTGLRPEGCGGPSDRPPPSDPTWYYRLNLLAAATLTVLVFCLFYRTAAWIGLGAAVISLGSLFFYHYVTRSQLGFAEFIVTITVLGNVLGLTFNLLWPDLRDTPRDWMILAVWLMEAAWILCGALWAGWVARKLHLGHLRERLMILCAGWLAPPAVPGLLAGFFFSIFGIPTWVLQYMHGEEARVYPWPVLFSPLAVLLCVWSIRATLHYHIDARAAERAEQDREEKIEVPRAFRMNLRQSTTRQDLPFDTDEATPSENAPPEDPAVPPKED